VRALALIALVTVTSIAGAAPPRPFTVEGISFKLFDEASGKVVSIDKPPNPYGSNLTLMIIVKLKGPTEAGIPGTLTLEASAPASSDEATGDHPPFKHNDSRALGPVGEKGVGYQLFLMPYECREQVTFTATIGKSSKTVKQALGCAE
jgi:hypothetical protein